METVGKEKRLEYLALKEIVFDTKYYPREKWNTATVNVYVDALQGGAKFPPLILEKGTNKIFDGVHRWKAHEKYTEKYNERSKEKDTENDRFEDWAKPQDKIDIEYHEVPEEIPVKLYAASLSTKHGERITSADRKNLARELFEDNPDFNLDILTQFINVSKSTAANYVADIRARRKEQQKMTAYRLHRLGWTQEEQAEAIGYKSQGSYHKDFLSQFPELEKEIKKILDSGIPHLDVAERFNMPLILVWAIDLAGRTDEQRFERLGIRIQPHDVWYFTKCNNLFGAEYPGRIPGELIAHVLYFYTNPGDTIIDPMAGSGTTLDVCLAMNRKCYAYDIDNKYERADIINHDIHLDKCPERIKKANLIFWDPPYFNKKEYTEDSISHLQREDYLNFFTESLSSAYQQVKKGAKLAFLMSDWNDEEGKEEAIFIWDYTNIILNAGWKMIRHIQVPLSTQQIHPDIMIKFRKARRLARLERYLIICEVE